MTSHPRHVVIVGAGVGGLTCARLLAAHPADFRVTVIDPSETHDFAPSFLWMLNATRTTAQVSRPLNVIETWGANRVEQRVTGLDIDAHSVAVESGDEYPYDTLILAPGAALAPDRIPGLAEHALMFYTRSDSERLAKQLQTFHGGRVLVVVPSMPYKCPAAPYESALLVQTLLSGRGIEYSIEIFTVEPQPLPVAGPKIGSRVAAMLAKRGIKFHTQQVLRDVESAQANFEHGPEPFDLMIAIPPHQAPDFVRTSTIANRDGWIPVDRYTMRAADDVYAIGDVTAIKLENGKPLPKAGVFAHAQGEVVARNLIAEAQGSIADRQFDGHGACFLEIGHGKAGVASGNFYATPNPSVRMFPPSRLGHLGKVLFERRWLKQLK